MAENKDELDVREFAASGENRDAGSAETTSRTANGDSAEKGDSPAEATPNKTKAAGKATTNIVGQAKEKASSLLDDQKNNVAAGIVTIADSIRHIGENLLGDQNESNQIASFAAQYGDSLAERVENFSHYVEDRDVKELVREAEGLARRNPTLFVGGAFALGILAARFLKSSGSRRKH